MKALLIFIYFCFLTLALQAQGKITLRGDKNDPKLINKKKMLEDEGFTVEILPEKTEEDTDDVLGDENFIEKHTDQTLPPFELTDIEGNKISSQELKGKLVHINFWSVTCKPCIQEFPELNDLKEKYSSEDFVFLAFAPESKAKVKKILDKHPLHYRIISDAQAYYEELGIDGYPKNFFVNRAGKIIKVMDGTRFKMIMKNGESKMIPDNFERYDEVLAEMK